MNKQQTNTNEHCNKSQSKVNRLALITLRYDDYIKQLQNELDELFNYYDSKYPNKTGCGLIELAEKSMQCKYKNQAVIFLRYDPENISPHKIQLQDGNYKAFPIDVCGVYEEIGLKVIYSNLGYCVIFKQKDEEYARRQLKAIVDEDVEKSYNRLRMRFEASGCKLETNDESDEVIEFNEIDATDLLCWEEMEMGY